MRRDGGGKSCRHGGGEDDQGIAELHIERIFNSVLLEKAIDEARVEQCCLVGSRIKSLMHIECSEEALV